jgi:hypothetical protein
VQARSIRKFITWGLLVLGSVALTPTWAQGRTYPSDTLCKREHRCRECNGPGCAKVATPAPWPEGRVEEGIGPFIMGALFKVTLPKGASQYIVLADGDITVDYGPDRWVGIQTVTAAETHFPLREGQKNTRPNALAHADIPRILYSKTLDDAEPAHIEDLRIWRSALMYKGSAFNEATQATVAERGSLTAYLSDARIANDTTVGYVTHKRLKDSYLLVQTKGFSFDDFRRVIGSIEALRE